MNNSDLNNNSNPQVQPLQPLQPLQPQIQPTVQLQVQPQIQPAVQPQVQPQAQPQSMAPTPIINSNEPTMISSDMFGSRVEVNPTVTNNPVPDSQVVQPQVPNMQVGQGAVPPTIYTDNMNTFGSDNSNSLVNENLKKVEVNYKPPSKAKVAAMLILFVLLVAFVIFLPEVSRFINTLKSGGFGKGEEVITTGTLKCTLEDTTTNFTIKYVSTFNFTESKLTNTKFSVTTSGDPSEDEAELDTLAEKCNNLTKHVKKLNGVSVLCDYSDGKLVETQIFDLEKVNMEEMTSAFIEAGGNSPEYTLGQDINVVEKNMNASGYTCVREKENR